MSASENSISEEVILSNEVMPEDDVAHPVTTSNGASNGTSNGNSTDVNGVGYANNGRNQSSISHDLAYQNQIDVDDPFRYGYRYIEFVDENGRIGYEQIPLTLEDLLHPQEEDFRVQGPKHIDTCVNLRTILNQVLNDYPSALVLYDVRVDWNVPGIKALGPDITVILEADMQPPEKGTFIAGEDGSAPIMVIEVTSPSTRSQDFYEKPALKQRLKLAYYFVADLVPAPERRRIYGYELTPEGCYIGIRPNEHGWVWMEPVGLWLGLRDGEVECYDTDGNLMLGPQGLVDSLRSETERATEAVERATEAVERATEADQRATEAVERATEADQRADTLDEEKQRLEDYLRSIGIDPTTIPKTQSDDTSL